MNIALGVKVLWHLITGQFDWWKQVLFKKYLHGNRKRCLDHPLDEGRGSPIWKLCKAVACLIQSKLTWIPGNGRLISIWDDSIMGKPPNGHNQELLGFRH